MDSHETKLSSGAAGAALLRTQHATPPLEPPPTFWARRSLLPHCPEQCTAKLCPTPHQAKVSLIQKKRFLSEVLAPIRFTPTWRLPWAGQGGDVAAPQKGERDGALGRGNRHF